MEQLTNIKTFIQLQVQEKEKKMFELEKEYEGKLKCAVISEENSRGAKIFTVLRHSNDDIIEYRELHTSIMALEKVLDYVYDEITKLNNINK